MNLAKASFLQKLGYLYGELYTGKKFRFQRKAKEVLLDLVLFVESGIYVRSKGLQFIASHWRMSAPDIHCEWEAGDNPPRAVKTMYSGKSRLSQKLERMFPFDIVGVFQDARQEELRLISMVISACRIGVSRGEDVHLAELFGIDFAKYCVRPMEGRRRVEDCTEELKVLRLLTRSVLEDCLSQLDGGNLWYIREVLSDRLLSNAGELNLEKARLLAGLDFSYGKGVFSVLGRMRGSGVSRTDAVEAYAEESPQSGGKASAKARFGFADTEKLAALLEEWAGREVDAGEFAGVAGKQEEKIRLILSVLTVEGVREFLKDINPADLCVALYAREQEVRAGRG